MHLTSAIWAGMYVVSNCCQDHKENVRFRGIFNSIVIFDSEEWTE